MQLYETGLRSGGEADWVAFPNFRDWRSGSRAFEEMAAYRYALLTLTGPEGAESMLGLEVTDRLFAVLRVAPLLGPHLPARRGRARTGAGRRDQPLRSGSAASVPIPAWWDEP